MVKDLEGRGKIERLFRNYRIDGLQRETQKAAGCEIALDHVTAV